MFSKIRKEFPLLSQYTYANIAASGVLYESLMEWRQAHDMDFLIKGSKFRDTHHEFIEEIRSEVGAFFKCNPQYVSLIPNFSFGFNTVLEGLQKKQKVLLLENDYPSVNEPVEDRDFDTVYIPITSDLETSIEVAVSTHQPDILALSIVQYINGVKIDLEFLKSLKEKHPSMLIIADGTQYCGTEAFDFENSGIDILGASAYKWLLSGYGNGFMLFKEDVIEKIYSDHFKKVKGSIFSKKQEHLMHFFEPGHQDTFNYGSLKFSLQFLKDIGQENIEKRLVVISKKMKKALEELELLDAVVAQRKEHSTIFNIKGDHSLFEQLLQRDIICSKRGSGIRLSFHFFNTDEELDMLITTLKELAIS